MATITDFSNASNARISRTSKEGLTELYGPRVFSWLGKKGPEPIINEDTNEKDNENINNNDSIGVNTDNSDSEDCVNWSNNTSRTNSTYMAELVQVPYGYGGSDSSGDEKGPSAPMKPLKAATTTTNFSDRNNYEILKEIKPDHPLRIHYPLSESRRSTLIAHNPLMHHHRNSYYSVNSFTYYTPPRHPLPSSLKTSQSESDDGDDDGGFFSNRKYLFWTGFLFMPFWWFGSFRKAVDTEDYMWRKRCRKASTWGFVALIIAITIIVIISQRRKIGL